MSTVWLRSLTSLTFVLICACSLQATDLPAQPVLKNGSCPTGYRTSGDYCMPRKDARFAVLKVGSCPTGYRTSGKYCVARKKASFAVPKSGSCPSGYRTSGAYCIAR